MTDDKMLDRVRKLLAKAENAGSEHEAEAFTAKATELMLKYSIDEALLQQAGEKPNEQIIARTVHVEGYVKAKLSLMHCVARGLGLRSVQYSNSRGGWATGSGQVVGWESDVAAFDVLFASLQMQAAHEADRAFKLAAAEYPVQRAAYAAWMREYDAAWAASDGWQMLTIERTAWRDAFIAEHGEQPEFPGEKAPHGRAFRQSFLIGYADVIGARLRKQRSEAVRVAEDTTPGAAVAVRDRGEAVSVAADRMWGKLGKGTAASTSSNSGYYSGRAAGARANLGQTSVGGGRRAIGR